MLAFVGYCVWPSVSELTSDPPPPKPPAKVPELAAALFSPTMPPRPTKNPWGGKDAASLAAAKEAAKAADKTAEAPAGSAAAKTPDKPVDPLDGLKLDATCILGDQRLAVINGQLYAPQETLSAGNSSTPPFKIVSVLPYKVLLEREGKTVELTYSDVVSRPASSPQADRAGGKPTPPTARRVTRATKPPAASTASQSGGNNQSSKAGK